MKKRLFCLLPVLLACSEPVMANECTHISGSIAEDGGFSDSRQFAQLPIRFDAEIPWSHLQAGFNQLKHRVQEVELQALTHDANSLKIQLLVHQAIFWDTLQLQLDNPKVNTLRIRLLDNWIPSHLIFERLKTGLDAWKTTLPLEVSERPNELAIVLHPSLRTSKSSSTLNQAYFDFRLDKRAFLQIVWQSGKEYRTVANSTPQPELANLGIEICGQPAQGLSSSMQLALWPDLKPKTVESIEFSGEKLGERVQALKGVVFLESKGKLGLDPFTYQAEGRVAIRLQRLMVEKKTYKKVHAAPFKWSYTYPDQLSIYPQLPAPKPVSPNLQPSQLTLFADGPAYFDEIMKTIAAAHETIAQEVFSFHDGQTTRALAQLLVKKAIGMQEAGAGLVADPASPSGVKVYFLHNHGLKAQGAEEVLGFFRQAEEDVFSRLKGRSAAQVASLQERLRQNLRITALTDGPAWADHRKLLVIDGKIGYVGGRNWGDSYFTADSFRDQMVKVEGPTVRQMQQAFITNWNALNPGQSLNWPLKSEAELMAGLPAGSHLSPAAILTTSHKAWEIEAALLKTINEARHEIRIEHAYIYHEPIEAALRAAKHRGVNIRLMFSERSDESVFERVNPATAIKLMRAPGKGKVDCWLYQDPGGKDDYMVHTKFLSADGHIAIAGSANLIPRSLHSPFTAEGGPLLFNEEIVIYVDDPDFVGQMDREIFEKRLAEHSRKAGIPELQALIDARGGSLRLLVEKLKGLLS